MNSKIVGCISIFIVVCTVGCTNQSNNGNGGGEDQTTYSSFTNSEFSVEYPSDWTIFTEDSTPAGISTEAFFGAENAEGAGLYIRGHQISGSLMDYDAWYESALDDLQSSGDATVLDNELYTNEGFIEFTSLSSDVTMYSQYKFIGCLTTTYQCTASVENTLRSEYQNIIDHIISSFECI